MPHPQPESELTGALLIDTPAGPTSHDIVDIVRNLFRIKKVGHCGTLDPGATGLLVCLLGRATKLSQKLMAEDKAMAQYLLAAGADPMKGDVDLVREAMPALPPRAAASAIALVAASTESSATTTSSLTLGRKSTVYSLPR